MRYKHVQIGAIQYDQSPCCEGKCCSRTITNEKWTEAGICKLTHL